METPIDSEKLGIEALLKLSKQYQKLLDNYDKLSRKISKFIIQKNNLGIAVNSEHRTLLAITRIMNFLRDNMIKLSPDYIVKNASVKEKIKKWVKDHPVDGEKLMHKIGKNAPKFVAIVGLKMFAYSHGLMI